MAYDIGIMRTGPDGKVDYRFSGLSHRIVGKEKMVQHYIKYLYADSIGGLIKLFRSNANYGTQEIVSAAYKAFRYQKALQSGKALHPDEAIANISIKNINIDRKGGRVDIEIVIKSISGDTANIAI